MSSVVFSTSFPSPSLPWRLSPGRSRALPSVRYLLCLDLDCAEEKQKTTLLKASVRVFLIGHFKRCFYTLFSFSLLFSVSCSFFLFFFFWGVGWGGGGVFFLYISLTTLFNRLSYFSQHWPFLFQKQVHWFGRTDCGDVTLLCLIV